LRLENGDRLGHFRRQAHLRGLVRHQLRPAHAERGGLLLEFFDQRLLAQRQLGSGRAKSSVGHGCGLRLVRLHLQELRGVAHLAVGHIELGAGLGRRVAERIHAFGRIAAAAPYVRAGGAHAVKRLAGTIGTVLDGRTRLPKRIEGLHSLDDRARVHRDANRCNIGHVTPIKKATRRWLS
jgi:hypothetical protein